MDQGRIPHQRRDGRLRLRLDGEEDMTQGFLNGLGGVFDDVEPLGSVVIRRRRDKKVLDAGGIVGRVHEQLVGPDAVRQLPGVDDGDLAPRGTERLPLATIRVLFLSGRPEALRQKHLGQVAVPLGVQIPDDAGRAGQAVHHLQQAAGLMQVPLIHQLAGQMAVRFLARGMQGDGLAKVFALLVRGGTHHAGHAQQLVAFRGAHVRVFQRQQARADGFLVLPAQKILHGDVVPVHPGSLGLGRQDALVALSAAGLVGLGHVGDAQAVGQAHGRLLVRLDPLMDGALPVSWQHAVRLAAEHAFPAVVPHAAVLHVVPGHQHVPALRLLVPLLNYAAVQCRLVA